MRWARLMARWRASPDREHEMMPNRIAAGLVIVGFNMGVPTGWMPQGAALAAVAYVAAGVMLCMYLLVQPSHTRFRRQLSLVLDMAAVSFEMHSGGAATAWLYPAYLWVVFGNGLRFGPKQMLLAMIAALAAFFSVIITSAYWASQPFLCGGLLIGLFIIPMYTFSLLERLSRARTVAIRANQSKSLFLASVSHELRTPLNAIIGLSALLEETRLDADQRDMSQTVLSSARSLLSLIDGILDFSRLEAGRMPVSVSTFDLMELLEELRRMVLAQAREKGLALGLHVTAHTPLDVVGDLGQLREILLNLLSNAVKFTAQGSVTISVDAIAHEPDSSTLRFEVRDTGIGIAPEAQGRIFDMFTQADETIANRFGGTGLGLSITRQLVELLGGKLGLTSVLGQGTTMWVELPLQRAVAPAWPADALSTRCFLLADPAGLAQPCIETLRGMGIAVEAVPDAPRPGLGGAGRAVFALVRRSAAEPGLPFERLVRDEALTYFEVAETADAAQRSGPLEGQVVVRTHAGADADELLRILRICDAVPVARGGVRAGPLGARTPSRALILVADDNRVNQKVITRILERAGFVVLLANDGDEMLDLLETKPVELAIADVNMPRIGGIEATQLYRVAALDRPRIPIIALTADATPETRERCLAAGMDLCLLKPIEPVALIRALDELLVHRPPPEPAPASLPRFPAISDPVIDPEALGNLRALGGGEFVAEIVDDFVSETGELIAALRHAMDAADTEAFRANSHALRSGAANIGAVTILKMAEPWELSSAEQIGRHGKAYIADLDHAFGRTVEALVAYKAELAVMGL